MADLDKDGTEDTKDDDIDGDGVKNYLDPAPRDAKKTGGSPVGGGEGGDSGDGGTGGTTDSGIRISPTQTKANSVAWVIDPKTGEPTGFVSPANAAKYLKQGTQDWKIISAAFATYGGELTNTNSVAAFWKKLINESSGTSSSPFDVMQAYRAQHIAAVEASKIARTSSSKYFTYTSKANAYSDIEKLYKTTFGVEPTAAEKARYYNQLHAAETKAATTTTYTTVNGVTSQTTQSSKVDLEGIQQSVIANVIAAYNKKHPGKKLLGTAGTIQGDLKTYANSEMGLDMSDKEINILVAKVLGGYNIQDAYKSIKNNAINAYGNYAKLLKEDNPGDLRQGSTVRSLANNYIQMMANTLELNPEEIKITDPTISNLLTGEKLPSIAEAKQIFRKDKRWNNTQAAVEESKQIGYSLLRAFGYNL